MDPGRTILFFFILSLAVGATGYAWVRKWYRMKEGDPWKFSRWAGILARARTPSGLLVKPQFYLAAVGLAACLALMVAGLALAVDGMTLLGGALTAGFAGFLPFSWAIHRVNQVHGWEYG